MCSDSGNGNVQGMITISSNPYIFKKTGNYSVIDCSFRTALCFGMMQGKTSLTLCFVTMCTHFRA